MQTEEQIENRYKILSVQIIVTVWMTIMLVTVFGEAFAATYYPSIQSAFNKVFDWASLVSYGYLLNFYVPMLIRLNKDREYRLKTIEGLKDFFGIGRKILRRT